MKRLWMSLILLLLASSAWGQIRVESARWQVIGGERGCDARRQVSDLCNDREQCSIRVDPRFLCGGDPAPGKLKSLNVSYTCYGSQQPVLAFRDGTQAVLRCGNNDVGGAYEPPLPQPPVGRGENRLQIFAARWEVIGGGAGCDATEQLVRACDGKRFCELFVDPRYLCNGDPAPKKKKRLDVRYACNGERQPPAAFDDFSEVKLRCGRRDRDNPPSPNRIAQIVVESARWEVIGGGRFCDATQDMAAACNGKPFCQVQVEPRNLCGRDPAPGRSKSLLIAYTCDGRQQIPIAYPDLAQAILRCDGVVLPAPPPPSPPPPPVVRRPGIIKVQQARWEQVGGGGYCEPTARLMEACDGKTRCKVRVDAESLCNFDPAPGSFKSLDVYFTCDGKQQGPISFPDEAQAILNCE